MSIKFNFNVDYASKFRYCVTASVIMMIAFATMFFKVGLNYGVDFRGGAEIQVKMAEKADQGDVRTALEGVSIPISSVQSIGTEEGKEYLIKVQTEKGDLNKVSNEVKTVLAAKFGSDKVEILKNDIVGPKAGEQLRNSAFQAMAWSLLAIMIYLSLRFDFKYAPGAIAALIHDVLFMIGCFILTQKEFSLQIVAALLAIIGYSVNDTVVIYDRVRELEGENPGVDMNTILNRAINETMSRTILTAGTVFIVCAVMFFLGGPVIHDFAFAMVLGTLSGTYSTVFIASPITIWLDKFQDNQPAKPAKAT